MLRETSKEMDFGCWGRNFYLGRDFSLNAWDGGIFFFGEQCGEDKIASGEHNGRGISAGLEK